MAALTAYAAGLTTSGMEILSKALTEVFGEISINELGKDNLRYCVRMSMKSSSIVLVVLDSSSEELCRDIENGLYLSDKYFCYSSERDLALFLNQKYSLNLEVPEDVEELETVKPLDSTSSQSDSISELKDLYESQLADKNALIKSLNCTIRGLEKIISEEGSPQNSEEMESLQEDNRTLRSSISDMQTQLDSLMSRCNSYEGEVSELSSKLESTKNQLGSLRSVYDKVNKDFVDLKVESSQKSGVIRDKDHEISRLSKQLEGMSEVVEKHRNCESTISLLKTESELLRVSISDKDSEIARLQLEIKSSGKSQEQLEIYKELLSQKQSECAELKMSMSSVEEELNSLKESYGGIESENYKMKESCETYVEKLKTADMYISELNTKNLSLTEKIRVLEQSTSRDANMEDTLVELASLRRKYSELQGNVFNVLYSKALPKSASNVALFNTSGLRFDNITFVFSGSTESRKGTYKNISAEMSGDPHGKYLLVDAVSETFVDYVFKIEKVVNGLKWFTDGGGVQQYITQTCLSNVRVLSPGLGYINDSFFLALNWEKRLNELNNSGYKVILYCGDLSNIVGRVLFENFSLVGKTDIYVHGNSVGSRTIVGVSRGISGIKNATVKYFEYDPKVSKFVNHMEQRCSCEIVSSISRGV